MAASITWSESNGAGESVTDSLTNLNYGSADTPNLTPADNKITAGNYSYEKYNRIKVGGTFTELTDMKLWKSSGAYGTGEVINAIANQTYATPVATASSKATSAIPTAVGSALTIQSTEADTSKFATTGYSKYFVTQMATSASTPPGVVAQKVFTFQWSES